MREFRLPIRAEIFIAEATHDLKILLHAADHQQLLENLRRLRERVELPGIESARHEKIARAFRRRTAEHRRFNLQKAVLVEIIAHDLRHAVPEHDVLLHFRTPQVEIPIPEPNIFVNLDAVLNVERRSLRLVEYPKLGDDDLDLARRHFRIDRLVRTRANGSVYADHEFIAKRFGFVECLFTHCRFVENNLHQAGTVAHVDKDQSAVIAPTRYPTRQIDLLAFVGFAELAAIHRSFHSR